eukprot:TRINITY_DN512_c0_g2_i1.p1 TRINITY_DN512_c0_g2~~TRINITY_DN512_c0_g2_i1.p1  ORF type:complete len:846 (-),score=178.40 TRINITY_DN512_c0_g2_i1:1361-3898(-)
MMSMQTNPHFFEKKFVNYTMGYEALLRLARFQGFEFRVKRTDSVDRTPTDFKKHPEKILRRYFECVHAGHTQTARKPGTGCRWRVSIIRKVLDDGNVCYMFSTKGAEMTHTGHAMSPCPSLLSLHRKLKEEDKQFCLALSHAHIPPLHIVEALRLYTNDDSKFLLTQDVSNFLYRSRGIVNPQEGDASAFVKRMSEYASKDEMFVFDWFTGFGNTLTRAFFSFPAWRDNYALSCQTVGIDATYKTNHLGMKTVMFVGEDRHGRTLTFACGLLLEETTSAYEWLLSKFKKSINFAHPFMIITDADPALAASIGAVFPPPRTTHAVCRWHFLKNVNDKLRTVMTKRNLGRFKHELCDLLLDGAESNPRRRFEDICQNYEELQDNEYCDVILARLHTLCEGSLPNRFIGTMTTTQRNESRNALLKKTIRKGSSTLLELFSALESHCKQTALQHSSTCPPMKDVKLKGLREMLLPGRSAKFIERQRKLSVDMKCWQVNDGVYCVQNKNGEEITVKVDPLHFTAECDCHAMERRGIPCAHVQCLAVQFPGINLSVHHFFTASISPARTISDLQSLQHLMNCPSACEGEQEETDGRGRIVHQSRIAEIRRLTRRLEEGVRSNPDSFLEVKHAIETILGQHHMFQCSEEDVVNPWNPRRVGRPCTSTQRRVRKKKVNRKRIRGATEAAMADEEDQESSVVVDLSQHTETSESEMDSEEDSESGVSIDVPSEDETVRQPKRRRISQLFDEPETDDAEEIGQSESSATREESDKPLRVFYAEMNGTSVYRFETESFENWEDMDPTNPDYETTDHFTYKEVGWEHFENAERQDKLKTRSGRVVKPKELGDEFERF